MGSAIALVKSACIVVTYKPRKPVWLAFIAYRTLQLGGRHSELLEIARDDA